MLISLSLSKSSKMKEESSLQKNTVCRIFYLTCITLATIFSPQLIFNNTSFSYRRDLLFSFIHTTNSSIQLHPNYNKGIGSCDLYKGRWVPDPNATLYTNNSCSTIPLMRNCLFHGRKNTDYLNWKWKPDQCELPRFDALSFLSILRGKKMAFIGDSLARNQVDSLLCLLSTVEIPESREENLRDKNGIWEFREHNFTLTVFWSPFLVAAAGIRSFDVHLDRVDALWSSKLPSMDYAVFSASYWFSKPIYFHEGGHVIGCVDCSNPNTTAIDPGRAIRMAFRAALRAVNECGRKTVSFVRTTSADHFENGSWSNGGRCNRTRPVEREEVDRAKPGLGYSKIQLEEMEMARSEGEGKGNVFEFIDVTEMMAMRADGHPGRYWGVKGASDCLHWCLPGPVDTWNELLLERIKRLDSISSHN